MNDDNQVDTQLVEVVRLMGNRPYTEESVQRKRLEAEAQFKNFSVCQICGRWTKRGDPEWIDAPRRDGTGRRVVRCPLHWSEWALRWSIGRTTENRRKMRELAEKYKGLSDPEWYEPFPILDVEDEKTIFTGGKYGF